jgi:SAM-dependent methyltransferase
MIAMVAECAGCRLGYQTPRPSVEACIAYMDWRWSSQQRYVTDNPEKRAAAATQIALVSARRPAAGRLLDFGAGSGTFVRAAIDAGWDAVGVEHSTAAARRAKEYYGVDLVGEIPGGKFDVITLWDVVEHLKEPIKVLESLRESMVIGGSIIISTGNYESWMRKSQGDRWGLYLLDHHYYFTPASLEETLKRSGFFGFELFAGKRMKPSFRLYRHPIRAFRDWAAWLKYRKKWPTHFDIHEMVVIANRGEDRERRT